MGCCDGDPPRTMHLLVRVSDDQQRMLLAPASFVCAHCLHHWLEPSF
jgi:hypothetical protein